MGKARHVYGGIGIGAGRVRSKEVVIFEQVMECRVDVVEGLFFCENFFIPFCDCDKVTHAVWAFCHSA